MKGLPLPLEGLPLSKYVSHPINQTWDISVAITFWIQAIQPRTSERGVNLESLLMDLSRTQSVTNQPMAIPGTNAVGYQWMDLPPTHVLITACLRLPD